VAAGKETWIKAIVEVGPLNGKRNKKKKTEHVKQNPFTVSADDKQDLFVIV